MNDTTSRPPYLAALAVTLVVLAGYVLTLAPTVTFWDAGEFIAASKILGIPHPPGTPLFVMVAHVWGMLVPAGEYAQRTNLLSATMSAAGAGFFFLVVHESLRSILAGLPEREARWLRLLGGGAAAVLGAFTFTNWQNSNETEVYAVATFTIAAVSWLALDWRRQRGTARAPRMLLLIVFLAGISIGNHLLALLAGPGVVACLVSALWRAPAADPGQRRVEWAQVAVVAATWVLLIGTGLGSTSLVILGLLCFAAAAVYAARVGAFGFAVAALLIAAVGLTPYLYPYIRSAQSPMINEAAPSNWKALLGVIRREQYGVRTPLDDPTVFHGPDNPGRSLQIIWLQIQNYALYFGWQWARGLADAGRVVLAVIYLILGIRGSLVQRRADRDAWWLLFGIWLVTGIGLLVYMNFKPGFSQGYDLYPSPGDHEVRERDYFYVVSFVIWGLWAGIALVEAVGRWLRADRVLRRRLAWAPLALTAVPIALNWREADRRHGPDARLAADFAYDLLNSAPPHGVLFTYGDNDTFPLWWAQEVAGIRRDVAVVCLALAQTDWYVRQLRDNPARPFDEAAAAPVWRGKAGPAPTQRLHSMSDQDVAAAMSGYAVDSAREIRIGPMVRPLPPGTVLYPNDILSLRVIQENYGRRPIVWATTTGRDFAGFGRYVVQQGLAYRLDPETALRAGGFGAAQGGEPIDEPLTRTLAWETYRYAGLLQSRDNSRLDPTARSIAATLATPFTGLAILADARGDSAYVVRNLERAVQLAPQPALQAALAQYRRQPVFPMPPDTAESRRDTAKSRRDTTKPR